MRARFPVLLLLTLLAVPGCVGRSLQPAWRAGDLVSEPALVGDWEGLPRSPADSSDDAWAPGGTWSIRRGPEGSYLVRHVEGEDVASYRGHVFRLGDGLFLDLLPEPSSSWMDRYAFHVALCHTFHRLRLDGDTLSVSYLQASWLDEQSKRGRLERAAGLAHDEAGPILTGDTPALRRLLARAAADPGAFARGRFVRARLLD